MKKRILSSSSKKYFKGKRSVKYYNITSALLICPKKILKIVPTHHKNIINRKGWTSFQMASKNWGCQYVKRGGRAFLIKLNEHSNFKALKVEHPTGDCIEEIEYKSRYFNFHDK